MVYTCLCVVWGVLQTADKLTVEVFPAVSGGGQAALQEAMVKAIVDPANQSGTQGLEQVYCARGWVAHGVTSLQQEGVAGRVTG